MEDFLRASEWLARGSSSPGVVVAGAPFAGGSISRARCDLAPAAIRAELARFSVYSSDEQISLEQLAVSDAGDVALPSGDVAAAVEALAVALKAFGAPLALLGGDNSVTAGGVRGTGADALITFDAHHDCRSYDGGRTNGSVVRELVDGGLRASNITQIGIHGFANAEPHAHWARDAGISFLSPRVVRTRGIDVVVGEAISRVEQSRIWVDFDMDCLDRAFAPGAPAAMPGGLWPADLERAAFLLGRNPSVIGMDITEVDPTMDVGSITVRAACSVLLSFCAGVTAR
ncbi:MAG: agmatinase family protein [Actinobacteria bacterium]|nr:agmatinase family protein [Actinomycetota bacterium]